ATTQLYTLSLHDALPIYSQRGIARVAFECWMFICWLVAPAPGQAACGAALSNATFSAMEHGDWTNLSDEELLEKKIRQLGLKLRSEEHTSELQSRGHLVC